MEFLEGAAVVREITGEEDLAARFSISRASAGITGDPHQPVSPTTLTQVDPEGGVVGVVAIGVWLTGTSTSGGVVVIGGVVTTGGWSSARQAYCRCHQAAPTPHPMSTTSPIIRGGRGRMLLPSFFFTANPMPLLTRLYCVSAMKRAATILAVVFLTIALTAAFAHAQTADALFASANLQRVDLFLHSADWAKLRAEFQTNTYYPANLTLNGQTVRNIGIRSRGRGSRSSRQTRVARSTSTATPRRSDFSA